MPCYRIREPNFQALLPSIHDCTCLDTVYLCCCVTVDFGPFILCVTVEQHKMFSSWIWAALPYNPASASYSELQKASPTNGCSMVALAHHINLEISTWPSLSSHRSFSQEVSRCLKLVRSLMNPYGKPCVISLIVFSLLLC